MSSTSLSVPVSCAFLRAPVEIRVEIYRYLLSAKYIKHEIKYEVSVFHAIRDYLLLLCTVVRCLAKIECPKQHSNFETTYYAYPFQTQILYTNRQIREEAAYVLYKENSLIRFTSDHPTVRHILWKSRGALSLALGDSASWSTRIAMNINHYCPFSETTKRHRECDCTKDDSNSCLLIADQLPNLLRTLRATSQQGNQELAKSSFSNVMLGTLDDLSLDFLPGRSFIPASTRNLLDPFKVFYELEALRIIGIVNDEYKHSIVSSATQPEPTVAETIESASAIQVEGDEAFQKQQFDLALSLYKSALREFQVNCHRSGYTGQLTTGQYAHLSTPHAVRCFQIHIHRSLTLAHFQVGEYHRAIKHAFAAIKYEIDTEVPVAEQGLSLSRTGIATPFFWGGLAYEGLGDLNRALYGVGEAMFHDDGNKMYAEEYRRLEAEMEKRGVEAATHQYGKGTNWWVG